MLTGPDAIREVCQAASSSPDCVGVITWMHTFSPAKMWIAGLTRLTEAARPSPHPVQPRAALGRDRHGLHEPEPVRPRRPGVRVHRARGCGCTGRSWSATGRTPEVLDELAGWARAALALAESQRLKIARFGGMNMREVAVTGGDRVEAQIQLGWSINGYAGGRPGPPRRPRSPTPRWTSWSRSTRAPTRWRRRCARAARSARACATRPGRRSPCAPSSRRAGSAPSPPRSRISTA